MALDTSTLTLSSALERALRQAQSIKRIAENASATANAGNVDAYWALALLDNLKGADGVITTAGGLPGINAYAQAQLGVDAVAEFTAVVLAIRSARDWLIAALPKDGGGFLLLETMNATGDRGPRTFTKAQTVQLRNRLDALAALII
jgi:hypothetical protein